ncbi:hypothetical protein [Amycolatopsis aidingensis]|uniref:hypothetical protein n=1 Tax=Amycolatopsis aidingensis TaxID=2842453 RepID=UPI001E4D241E|nr:hypothetical protein [Amycolatopsis aidingensis]
MVSIDGRVPISLACVILDSGDLLIPAGTDRALVRSAVGRPVTVEFAQRDRHGNLSWIVNGVGLARPMRHHDPPIPLPRTTVTATMTAPFENGIRVNIARFSGDWQDRG